MSTLIGGHRRGCYDTLGRKRCAGVMIYPRRCFPGERSTSPRALTCYECFPVFCCPRTEKRFGAFQSSQDVCVFLDHPSIFHALREKKNKCCSCTALRESRSCCESFQGFVAAQMFSPGASLTWQKHPNSWPLLTEQLLNSRDFCFAAFLQRRCYYSNPRGGRTEVQKLNHFLNVCTASKWVLIRVCLIPRSHVIFLFLSSAYFCSTSMRACVHAKSLQLYLTLCNPIDCNLPGSSVHGIIWARILE